MLIYLLLMSYCLSSFAIVLSEVSERWPATHRTRQKNCLFLSARRHSPRMHTHTHTFETPSQNSTMYRRSLSAGPHLTYDQPTINNHNKRPACARSCAACGDTRARVLAGTSLASPPRKDNFNLNKWLGGRHLCPRLVLFILDYSVRTCAAVSSGRVRCHLSRVNVFQNPPGIYLVVPDRASRSVERPDPFSRSPLRLSRLSRFSVFALIYAITTRDAFSSSRASVFVILCPAELRLRARLIAGMASAR